MENMNHSTMKKEDWKNLAVQYGIGFDEESTVRYFVEKIAEKIGVDDKIVNTNHLKIEVIAKINESNEVDAPTEAPTETFTIETNNDDVIKNLRDKCDKLGIGWSEIHTISDLTSIISAVEGSASVPTPSVSSSVSPVLNAPVNKNQSKFDTKNLEVYRDVIITGIRNHWRKMLPNEITEILNIGNYPFTYVMKSNPSNPLQLEILITMNGSTVRIPSQNNHDWIEING